MCLINRKNQWVVITISQSFDTSVIAFVTQSKHGSVSVEEGKGLVQQDFPKLGRIFLFDGWGRIHTAVRILLVRGIDDSFFLLTKKPFYSLDSQLASFHNFQFLGGKLLENLERICTTNSTQSLTFNI